MSIKNMNKTYLFDYQRVEISTFDFILGNYRICSIT
jgi:hypothetical protein